MSLQPKELFQLQWEDLLSAAQLLRFHQGQVLYYEGHLPYGIYWVKAGRVRFTHHHRCKQKHDEQPGHFVETEWLGLDEVKSQKEHCCTCIALTDCQVFFVNRTVLQEFLDNKKR